MDYDLDGARIPMTNSTSNPRANRFPLPLLVYCSFERMEGVASLVNISYTGALLGNTTMRPEIGARVTFYVQLKPTRASEAEIGTSTNLYGDLQPPRGFEAEAQSELTGLVVRHSSDGFAVEFESSHDPYMRRIVDDAAAIIAARR